MPVSNSHNWICMASRCGISKDSAALQTLNVKMCSECVGLIVRSILLLFFVLARFSHQWISQKNIFQSCGLDSNKRQCLSHFAYDVTSHSLAFKLKPSLARLEGMERPLLMPSIPILIPMPRRGRNLFIAFGSQYWYFFPAR